MRPKFLTLFILALLFASFASGQKDVKKITITGVVLDSHQLPVKNAEILIDGFDSGFSTNKKGTYKIRVNPSVKKIGVFALPPTVIEDPINGRTTINFTLNDSIVKRIVRRKNAYEEETVNVGYGNEKRKNLTTPVDKIDATKEKYASYKSIYDLIRGEVPGVQVSGTSILIRSASSVNSGTEPLYIVDGVPVNSLEGIQPQNVKTIEVLKGSAASIYGTRGSNGVIIITLKK